MEIRASIESSGTDWFLLGLILEADGQRRDLVPLVSSISSMLTLDGDGAPDANSDTKEFLEGFMLY